MQCALGMFVFTLKTAPISSRARSTDWRHSRVERLGKRSASHFLGPGADVVTLSGAIAHDIAGEELSLDVLRKMADSGEPWVLVYATGQVQGMFEIDSITETATSFLPNGKPRSIEFTLSMTRVDSKAADLLSLVTSPLSLLS